MVPEIFRKRHLTRYRQRRAASAIRITERRASGTTPPDTERHSQVSRIGIFSPPDERSATAPGDAGWSECFLDQVRLLTRVLLGRSRSGARATRTSRVSHGLLRLEHGMQTPSQK